MGPPRFLCAKVLSATHFVDCGGTVKARLW